MGQLISQCVRRYPKGALYIPLKSDGTPMSTVAFAYGKPKNIVSDLVDDGVGYLHARGKYATVLKKNTTLLERIILKHFVFKYNERQLKKK